MCHKIRLFNFHFKALIIESAIKLLQAITRLQVVPYFF